jgi:hypothetical protein
MSGVSTDLDKNNNLWYLAIDLGTEKLSALLFNQNLGKQYPIYWHDLELKEDLFSLKMAVFYSFTQKENKTRQTKGRSSFIIGQKAIDKSQEERGIFLESLKPYLNIALSCYSSQKSQWEPKLQQSQERVIPLYWIQKALQAVLTALTIHSYKVGLEVKAKGLSQEDLFAALENLQGVILSYPNHWGETYCFNLREAILGAKLIQKPEKIIFVEEAIASLLGYLPSSENLAKNLVKTETKEDQPTLMIHLGASTTNLSLVNLPQDLDSLTHEDFRLEGFSYGGLSIDIDILYQFIYPQWVLNPQQTMMPLDWDFPTPGIADPIKRDTVFLRLQGSTVGRSLLQAAQLVKLVLQKRKQFTSKLGDQEWGVNQQELREKIINPYLDQINYHLNCLLAKKGQSAQEIEQIFCSGGTSFLLKDSLFLLLEQKFPNAKITYPNSEESKQEKKMSRVVLGLASVLLFPKVINYLKHQYNDYFLFIELLKILPKHIFAFEDIKQELIQRGINTAVCEKPIIEFLQGRIPQGLIPSVEDCLCLAEFSQHNPDYQGLLSIPFCTIDSQGYYHPDVEQCQKLRQYLGKLLSSHKQQLSEPLALNISF